MSRPTLQSAIISGGAKGTEQAVMILAGGGDWGKAMNALVSANRASVAAYSHFWSAWQRGPANVQRTLEPWPACRRQHRYPEMSAAHGRRRT